MTSANVNEIPGSAILGGEEVNRIRHALLIGLASYAEIERLTNKQKVYESCAREVPEDLRLIHPTGAPDTVCEFAGALRDLEYAVVAK